MIIANGILKAKITNQLEELDSKGYPITSDDIWGAPIECAIKTNSQASVGITTSGNTFETSAFEVLIEEQPFDGEIVELVRNNVRLGLFQVQGKSELLTAVGCIKILVKCLSNV